MSLKCIKCNCDKRNYIQKLWRVTRQTVQNKYVRNNRKIAYIAISDLNEKLVKGTVKSENIYRVDNIVDLKYEKKAKSINSYMFLYVGRISEEKGVELFCQAVERLKKVDQRVSGCVVGEGILKRELEQRYPFIEFAGWKDKMGVTEYMLKARALVFPSKWYEGAPLTIIEALSIKLPCVVSDCTSATEVVHSGENGVVFRTNDLESLYNSLVKVLNGDLIRKMQENMERNFYYEKYSEKVYCDRIINAYYSMFN